MAKDREKKKIVSKKHLARADREATFNRYIVIASVVVFSLVIGIIGYGAIQEYLIRPGQPVAIVNGEEISTGEWQSQVRYERFLLVSQYFQLYSIYIQFGSTDDNIGAYYLNQLRQLEFQLEPQTLGSNVLTQLIEDRIIRDKAKELGITVTEEEIEKGIEEFFRYFPGGLPTASVTPTMGLTSTFSETQLAIVTITSTPTETATPTSTLTFTPEPTWTPNLTATLTSTATVPPTLAPTNTPSGPTDTPSPTLTPTEFTLESFQETYDSYLSELYNEIRYRENAFRAIIESQLYREKVFEAVTAEITPFLDQVWARHILVEDEETALDLIERIENGEDWVALAAEFSTDDATKDIGGNLDWFTVGKMDTEFEKVAFNTPIGRITTAHSTFGWHIIQVLGHEERQLSVSDYDQLLRETFGEWLTRTRNLNEVVILEYWVERVPLKPSIPPGASTLNMP